MDERLKRTLPEAPGEEARPSERAQILPLPVVSVKMIDDHPDEDQREAAVYCLAVRRSRAELPDVTQQRQPEREADRKEELRHDGVRVTVVIVVVLENGMDRDVAADEIHQKHPGHGIAAELVHRFDTRRNRL